ncbi:hypothetical protein WDU94_006029 [Cyamophila willieti]
MGLFTFLTSQSNDCTDQTSRSYTSHESSYTLTLASNPSLSSTDWTLLNKMRCTAPECEKVLPKAYCRNMDILCKYHATEYIACPVCDTTVKEFDSEALKVLKQYCEILRRAEVIDKHGNLL